MSWLKYAYDKRTICQRMIDDCKTVKDVISTLFHCKNAGGFSYSIKKSIMSTIISAMRMLNSGQEGKNTKFFDYMYKTAASCIEAENTNPGTIDISRTLFVAALDYIDNIPISELEISQQSLYDLAAGKGENGICTARIDPSGEFSRSIRNYLIEDTQISVPYVAPKYEREFKLKGFSDSKYE